MMIMLNAPIPFHSTPVIVMMDMKEMEQFVMVCSTVLYLPTINSVITVNPCKNNRQRRMFGGCT